MSERKAQLKSRVKLKGKGRDYKGNCIVEVDLERLGSLLEKEGLMNRDLGETIIELKDRVSIKIGNRKEIGIPLPIIGSYSYVTGTIEIYLHRNGGWYSLYKFLGRPIELTSKEVVNTLAHEIDHAIKDRRIRGLSKNQTVRNFLSILIWNISDPIYPISPLEIMARWFARSKAKDQEWLKCVKVRRISN